MGKFFMLGCCVGLVVGATIAPYGWSIAQWDSQPGNPYSHGQFQSEQRLYYDMLDRDTDTYLNQRSQQPRSLWSPCP